ncbi:MAG: energy transducer TonB [Chakrabartia sp.]
MAYADQEMSGRRIFAIGAVALLHAGVGYALVTGLAYNAAKQVYEDLKTFDVAPDEPEKPEEPPPPPPKVDLPPPPKVTVPPPVVTSPVVSTNTIAPISQTAVPAPPPAPAPPAPPRVAERAVQRGGSISDEDYPSSSIRNEEQGTSVATYTIGSDGKVVACNASGASPTLDAETCKLIMRRYRFKPAKDAGGQPIEETRTQRIRWVLPK